MRLTACAVGVAVLLLATAVPASGVEAIAAKLKGGFQYPCPAPSFFPSRERRSFASVSMSMMTDGEAVEWRPRLSLHGMQRILGFFRQNVGSPAGSSTETAGPAASASAATAPSGIGEVSATGRRWRRERSGRGAALAATAESGDVEAKAVITAEERKRVLILMSDTGGGHRASAQALEEALEKIYPGRLNCQIVDIWTEEAPWPYNTFVPCYKFLAKHPVLWRGFWEYGKFPVTRFLQEKVTLLACFRRFKRCVTKYQPDIVVSVHPLCQDIPLRALRQVRLQAAKQGGDAWGANVPFVTVVTDLGGAHPTWFDSRADLCFLPSDPIRKVALQSGVAPSSIRQYGLPIRAGFATKETRSKDEMRAHLGLKPGVPTALVVGGGDGVGGIAKIADELGAQLAAHSEETQMVVVCGKNEKAKRSLEGREWGDRVAVSVQGFVSNMEEFMAASDCLVTKAGPGTIAEAMSRGLPTMLSCYLPGQEAGNVPFVTEGGFGAYSSDPQEIASTVTSWMKDPSRLQDMSERATQAGRPAATYDIARDIGSMVLASSPADF